jgi:hypothetical protein
MNELKAIELLESIQHIANALERIAVASKSVDEHSLDTYEQNKS